MKKNSLTGTTYHRVSALMIGRDDMPARNKPLKPTPYMLVS